MKTKKYRKPNSKDIIFLSNALAVQRTCVVDNFDFVMKGRDLK